jgi:hypothetical protein
MASRKKAQPTIVLSELLASPCIAGIETTIPKMDQSAPVPFSAIEDKENGLNLYLQQTSPDVISPDAPSAAVLSPDAQSGDVLFKEDQPKNVPTDVSSPPVLPNLTTASRRVHRAVLVQDGHSITEQALYELLWKLGKNVDSDSYRIVQIGQSKLSETFKMTTRNLVPALERLVQKLSIEELKGFDRRTRTARTWKIYSYKSILERRKKAGLEWVVKDKGVHFVTAPATYERSPDIPSPDVFETSPDVTSPDGLNQSPDGASVVHLDRSPDGASETSGDGTSSRNTREFSFREKTTTSSEIAAALRKYLGHSDDVAVRRIETDCRKAYPEATVEEIVRFIQERGIQYTKSKSAQNAMALLFWAIPQAFARDVKQHRELERIRAQEIEASQAKFRSEWQKILDDPDAPEEDKKLARQLLNLEEP